MPIQMFIELLKGNKTNAMPKTHKRIAHKLSKQIIFGDYQIYTNNTFLKRFLGGGGEAFITAFNSWNVFQDWKHLPKIANSCFLLRKGSN